MKKLLFAMLLMFALPGCVLCPMNAHAGEQRLLEPGDPLPAVAPVAVAPAAPQVVKIVVESPAAPTPKATSTEAPAVAPALSPLERLLSNNVVVTILAALAAFALKWFCERFKVNDQDWGALITHVYCVVQDVSNMKKLSFADELAQAEKVFREEFGKRYQAVPKPQDVLDFQHTYASLYHSDDSAGKPKPE